jgi:folylpolyglutamate synthase
MSYAGVLDRSYWFQDRDIKHLNIVHIAGTKGKGSTCAFTRSFLRAHGLRTGFPKRVGLYTSPDLQCIRERIQIDDRPISEDLFTRYFFEVWEKLMSHDVEQNKQPARQPRYLQFMALLAFHAFIREKVDAAIFETHHGGEYDATNVIRAPVATGITSLGMDHIEQLGPTMENIAWHKAGIFKEGASAFSVTQEAGSAEVLRNRATEKKTNLTFVSTNMSLPVDFKALSVPVQRLNCSLALEITKSFLQKSAPDHTLTSDDISMGVQNFSWAGRFELIEDGKTQWFLDGAHNTLSLEQAAEWFAKNASSLDTRK